MLPFRPLSPALRSCIVKQSARMIGSCESRTAVAFSPSDKWQDVPQIVERVSALFIITIPKLTQTQGTKLRKKPPFPQEKIELSRYSIHVAACSIMHTISLRLQALLPHFYNTTAIVVLSNELISAKWL